MRMSNNMRLLALTIMQADNGGFTPENLAKYDEEKLNAVLLINNDLRDYTNSVEFFYDAKTLFNRIENATRAEILRRKQENKETYYSHPKEYHDDFR